MHKRLVQLIFLWNLVIAYSREATSLSGKEKINFKMKMRIQASVLKK